METIRQKLGWVELNYAGEGIYIDGCGSNGDKVRVLELWHRPVRVYPRTSIHVLVYVGKSIELWFAICMSMNQLSVSLARCVYSRARAYTCTRSKRSDGIGRTCIVPRHTHIHMCARFHAYMHLHKCVHNTHLNVCRHSYTRIQTCTQKYGLLMHIHTTVNKFIQMWRQIRDTISSKTYLDT